VHYIILLQFLIFDFLFDGVKPILHQNDCCDDLAYKAKGVGNRISKIASLS
jgi:hypothetical protein